MKCPEWHTSTSHSILFSSLDNCNLRALQTVFSMESIYIMYYVYICSDSLGILIGLKKSKLCEIAIRMRIRNFQFGSLNFRTRLQFYRRKFSLLGLELDWSCIFVDDYLKCFILDDVGTMVISEPSWSFRQMD